MGSAGRGGVLKGGTVNRPCTYVSYRKQKPRARKGGTSRHIFARCHSEAIRRGTPARSSALGRGRRSLKNPSWPHAGAGAMIAERIPLRPPRAAFARSRDTRHWPVLPGTVTRVETHLTYRKQSTGYRLTRNVPAHGYFRCAFAPVKAAIAHPKSAGQPPALQETAPRAGAKYRSTARIRAGAGACGRDRLPSSSCIRSTGR